MTAQMSQMLRLFILVTIIQATFVLAVTQLAGYSPVQVTHSAEFDASIETIWSFFSRFDSISKWETSLISSCLVSKPFAESFKSKDGDCLIRFKGNTPVGSIRNLNVRDKHVYEQLLISNALEHRITYHLLEYPESHLSVSPFPGRMLHDYTDVRLYAKGLNRTKVIWTAKFRTDKPAEMYDAFHGIYTRAGEGIEKTVQMLKANNIQAIDFLQ